MSLEKAGSWIGVIVFVGTAVLAYANLNNRLDNMNNQMAGLEKAIGSSACNAILPRQIEAIEKNHKDAREALERLSAQYDCGPHREPPPAPGSAAWADAMSALNATDYDTRDLNEQLNAVDVLLNNND